MDHQLGRDAREKLKNVLLLSLNSEPVSDDPESSDASDENS